MDTSESTTGSRNKQYALDAEDEDESRCNWDIEIIQFVVESFILMFPEDNKRMNARRSVRSTHAERQGRLKAHTSTDLSPIRGIARRSTSSSDVSPPRAFTRTASNNS